MEKEITLNNILDVVLNYLYTIKMAVWENTSVKTCN